MGDCVFEQMGIIKKATTASGDPVEALEVDPRSLGDIQEVCESICRGFCQARVAIITFEGLKVPCEAVILERVEAISVLSEP